MEDDYDYTEALEHAVRAIIRAHHARVPRGPLMLATVRALQYNDTGAPVESSVESVMDWIAAQPNGGLVCWLAQPEDDPPLRQMAQ